MEEMLELLRIYRTIQKSIFLIRIALNSFDKDVSTDNLSLFDYFYDFNSVNYEELYTTLIDSNVSYEDADRIIDALKILKETYEKYNVNNLDELSTLILSYWDNNKVYSDELIRNVLMVDSADHSMNNLPKSNVSLLDIYKDMVKNNMIPNPNIPIGNSYERLYVMLPEDSSCYESNLKIISCPTIDWSVYRNGCNPLEHYCFLYNSSQTEEERKYYHDVIITAINNSCSLFNNRFKWHSYSDKTEETINYYLLSSNNQLPDWRHPIKDIEFINEITSLLLTDELFNHQMELYTEKNDDAEAVIKELVMLRNNKDKIM